MPKGRQYALATAGPEGRQYTLATADPDGQMACWQTYIRPIYYTYSIYQKFQYLQGDEIMKRTNEPQHHLGKAMLFLLLAMYFFLPPAALDASGPAVSPSDATPPKPPANEAPAKTGLIQEGNYFVLYIKGTSGSLFPQNCTILINLGTARRYMTRKQSG